MDAATTGFLIAAPHSGAGKTTITLGLLRALRKRGLQVQSFKSGPDYIDTGLHTLVAGRPSRNLDSWMMNDETLLRLYQRAAQSADLCIVEGVMGLFDGSADGLEKVVRGSSAHLALTLGLPVVLVLDVRSAAQTVAALVHGLVHYERSLKIAGVILNRVGSERHHKMISQAIESHCGVPVLGAVPRESFAEMPSRHLGLVTASEHGQVFAGYTEKLALVMEQALDVGKLLTVINESQVSLSFPSTSLPRAFSSSLSLPSESLPYASSHSVSLTSPILSANSVKVALAQDEAFQFYYQDSLEDLAQLGIEWLPFSPLRERIPQEAQGVYLGGGYPELYLEQLTGNSAFFADLRHLSAGGYPIYAECGGYMCLCDSITDTDGREFNLAGLAPARCRMEARRVGLGYVQAEVLRNSLLGPSGTLLRGHEFHYSSITPQDDSSYPYAFALHKTGQKGQAKPDGYARDNLLASYFHYHFSFSSQIAQWFRNCLA